MRPAGAGVAVAGTEECCCCFGVGETIPAAVEADVVASGEAAVETENVARAQAERISRMLTTAILQQILFIRRTLSIEIIPYAVV